MHECKRNLSFAQYSHARVFHTQLYIFAYSVQLLKNLTLRATLYLKRHKSFIAPIVMKSHYFYASLRRLD